MRYETIPSYASEDRSDEEAANGISCKKFVLNDLRTAYPRPSWGSRRMTQRECRHCGRTITTLERAPVKAAVGIGEFTGTEILFTMGRQERSFGAIG